MPRTPVRRGGQDSVSWQAVVPWCSSCNRLMGEMVRCAREVNYFRYYKRLGPIANLATSYISKSLVSFTDLPKMQTLPPQCSPGSTLKKKKGQTSDPWRSHTYSIGGFATAKNLRFGPALPHPGVFPFSADQPKQP